MNIIQLDILGFLFNKIVVVVNLVKINRTLSHFPRKSV